MHNLFGVGGQSQVSQAAVGENSSCLGMILAEIGSSGLLQGEDISCRGLFSAWQWFPAHMTSPTWGTWGQWAHGRWAGIKLGVLRGLFKSSNGCVIL